MTDRSRFPDHRGLATWGERLVSLDEFAREAAAHGRHLGDAQRVAAVRAFHAERFDDTAVEGPFGRVAVFGGAYSNHLALQTLLVDARNRGAEAVYCLGDLGGFGPGPEQVWPLLEQGDVHCIQGNYEASLAAGEDDCNCGYTDPRDNHFAELSYEYTRRSCSDRFKVWMGRLPAARRVLVGSRELLLVHGSPRQVNEFLFYSTTPVAFLELLLERYRCDGFLCTHSGLHWHRHLPSGGDAINVGVIGRPANDGRPHVWYVLLEARGPQLRVEFVPLRYDHPRLAREMRVEGLPEEFVETILTGWWTTCLEILPAKERAASRY
jgi:hypothetical protein